jgi:predicted RNA binding protein YcfA (HicA-like mRNA interferase family)
MTKREKLRQRIEQNPKNVSMRELRALLEAYGFELDRVKGSHYSFIIEVGGREMLLVVPFRHPLHSVYVKKALALIEQIEAELSDDEDLTNG